MRSMSSPLNGKAGQPVVKRRIVFDSKAIEFHDVSLGVLCIFCQRDLEFLLIQARSLARFADRAAFSSVYLIWNEDSELPAARAGELHKILAAFQVRLLNARDFGIRSPITDGWTTQQALKVQAACVVAESHYMVLDAKNHFIAPTTTADFLNAAGQSLQTVSQLRGASARSFAFCLNYFGLDAAAHALVAALNVTPFIFETARARELVSFVEEKEDCALDEFLQSFSGHADRVTEFMLYQAFVILRNGSLDVLATGTQTNSDTLWSYEVEHRQTAEWIERVEAKPSNRVAGVHWLACMKMTEADRQLIAGFWQRHGLVKTQAEAHAVIKSVVVKATPGNLAFAVRKGAAAPGRR